MYLKDEVEKLAAAQEKIDQAAPEKQAERKALGESAKKPAVRYRG